jgi:hypothetical protein
MDTTTLPLAAGATAAVQFTLAGIVEGQRRGGLRPSYHSSVSSVSVRAVGSWLPASWRPGPPQPPTPSARPCGRRGFPRHPRRRVISAVTVEGGGTRRPQPSQGSASSAGSAPPTNTTRHAQDGWARHGAGHRGLGGRPPRTVPVGARPVGGDRRPCAGWVRLRLVEPCLCVAAEVPGRQGPFALDQQQVLCRTDQRVARSTAPVEVVGLQFDAVEIDTEVAQVWSVCASRTRRSRSCGTCRSSPSATVMSSPWITSWLSAATWSDLVAPRDGRCCPRV